MRLRRPDINPAVRMPELVPVLREDVEVPEREADGHVRLGAVGGGVFGHGDWAAELEVAEMRRGMLGAEADADEFDFGDDEAVAAVVGAHQDLQVGEVLEVFDAFLANFLLLAGVPAMERFDEADALSTVAKGARSFVGEVGDEVAAIFGGAVEGHGDVGAAGGGFQSGVDFGDVEVLDDGAQGGEVLGVGGGVGEGCGLWKSGQLHGLVGEA